MSKINMNYGWSFIENFEESYLSQNLSTENWHQVDIPHNVKDIPYNNFNERMYQFVSCYRKSVFISADTKGKVLYLEFEAVGHYAEVFVNGVAAFSHKGGYTAFGGDISGLVKYDSDNIITVKVDSREREEIPPFGNVIDYLCYGGIYRECFIYIHNAEYIASGKVSARDVLTAPKVSVSLSFNKNVDGVVSCKLSDDKGTIVAKYDINVKDANGVCSIEPVTSVKLWDIDSPNLYTLECSFKGEKSSYQFGFREATFTKKGFYLNGKKLKIVGLNRHQAYPYVGYAMPKSAQIADAELCKFGLGLNLVRTSHYPNSKHFLNRCDEIGLLVFTEIPGWQFVSEGEEWRELCVSNVEEMINEQYNHPSIILWGVRINESKDDNALYKATNEKAHKLDPTRQTGGVRCIPQSKLLEDVYTYNDFSHTGNNSGLLPKFIVCGNVPYLVTEHNGHMFPTKTFDHEKKRQEHLLRHAKVVNDTNKRNNTCGTIGWCMSDYNTHKDFGSGDKICYHGVTDMFRINKLAGYLYSAQQDNYPVLELTSNMEIGDNAGGQVGKVYMITNCERVNLYKNNVLINTFDINTMRAKSDYPYLSHPPIELFDIIGDQLEKNNQYKFTKHAANRCKKFLLNVKKFGVFPAIMRMPHTLLGLMIRYGLKVDSITYLFGEYVTNWGDESISYKLEGIKGEQTISVEKASVNAIKLEVKADSNTLELGDTYDVTRIAIRALSQAGNVLPYSNEVVSIAIRSDIIEVIGENTVALIGGQRAFWIKTKGKVGKAKITISSNIGTKVIDIKVVQGSING